LRGSEVIYIIDPPVNSLVTCYNDWVGKSDILRGWGVNYAGLKPYRDAMQIR
jgi:hypothetical protein